ncbi:hypothetical protein COB57_03355 [Candidatus Peregrinibacteria bacterium]|nr:MAG: hypothetical protein COB57_03355 [Candidatus Peregrinibacteria bacterium]
MEILQNNRRLMHFDKDISLRYFKNPDSFALSQIDSQETNDKKVDINIQLRNFKDKIEHNLPAPNRKRAMKNALNDGGKYAAEFLKNADYTEKVIESDENKKLHEIFFEEIKKLAPYIPPGEVGLLITNISEISRAIKKTELLEKRLHGDYKKERWRKPLKKAQGEALQLIQKAEVGGISRSEIYKHAEAEQQKIFLIHKSLDNTTNIIRSYHTSTGLNGYGSENGSGKTPLGLLTMSIGTTGYRYVEAGVGQKVKHHKAYNTFYDNPNIRIGNRNLVYKVAYPEGAEDHNKNSFQRGIALHATNQQDSISGPASRGCPVLNSLDINEMFSHIKQNKNGKAFIYITDKAEDSYLNDLMNQNQYAQLHQEQ